MKNAEHRREELVDRMKDIGTEAMVETGQDKTGRHRKEMGSHKGEARDHNSR